ncbi:MAG: hypothetical protein M0P66_11845 [Salinivirgaceae bacterium]|nr:hypothetical protein [Salinivirgaceae bacterium]
MKPFHSFHLLITGGIVFSILSCSIIEPPENSNPIDPLNPEFELPEATITSHFDGQIVLQPDITFKWKGRFTNSLYSFKLEGRDKSFSSWQNLQAATYNYIDEGVYVFQVKEKLGGYEQTLPTSATITMDALQQTSLIFVPWYQKITADNEGYVDLCLEEVVDFKGLTSKISLGESITITRIEGNNTIIENDGGSWVLLTNSLDAMNTDHLVAIDGVLLGGNPGGFTGNCPLCRIYFSAAGDGQFTTMPDSTKIRNTANENIDIAVFRGALVVCQ